VIRQFHPADTEAVVDLWRRCRLLRPWNDPHEDIRRKLAVGDDLFLVAEEEGRVVGSIMGGYDGHRGSIFYLAVDPDHRHRGWGETLLAEVELRLLERGCPKINLQVRTDNEETLGFYLRRGFAREDLIDLGKRLIEDG
jgi:ribosomal protein S18 acetylase RimI-like enzyme